jgi:hypothetical protein
METYYAYLRWCRDYNERNLIDPTSDKMEWNHTLPQFFFKGHGPGQWLTLKQHAIATALQTLAFDYCLLCPWHVQHLPDWLWEMCLPYRRSMSSKIAKKLAEEGHLEKMRACIDKEVHREAVRKVGQAHVESGHLDRIRALKDPVKHRENCSKMGKAQGRSLVESGEWKARQKQGAAAQHSQKWQCLVTGFISTPCGIAKYQRNRGIDPSLKVRIK